MFKVLVAPTVEGLAKIVNEELHKGLGWKPHGGIVIATDFGVRYYQAMYRYVPVGRKSVQDSAGHKKNQVYEKGARK